MHYKTLTGVGNLWVGGAIVAPNVPYRIDISREVRSGVPGLWQIEGEVDAPSPVLTKLVIDSPDDLELELSDGQRWGCLLQNNSGRLLNNGRRNLSVPDNTVR